MLVQSCDREACCRAASRTISRSGCALLKRFCRQWDPEEGQVLDPKRLTDLTPGAIISATLGCVNSAGRHCTL